MKNKSVNRRLPFNTDLLEYSRRELRIDEDNGEWEFARARTAALIGFTFLLRASELAALGSRDVAIGGNDWAIYARSFIRESKTDKEKVGDFRSSGETRERLRTYQRMGNWSGRQPSAKGEPRFSGKESFRSRHALRNGKLLIATFHREDSRYASYGLEGERVYTTPELISSI